MKNHLPALAAVAALVCSPAMAATLDFTGLPNDGLVATNPFSLPGATFTSSGAFYSNVNDYFDGEGGSICGISLTVGNCSADFTIDFDVAVTNLSFASLTGSGGNRFFVDALDQGGALLKRVDRRESGNLDFTDAAAPVASLRFTYVSGGSGLAFGRFNFDPVAGSVPEPGTCALAALGLIAAAATRRRRR